MKGPLTVCGPGLGKSTGAGGPLSHWAKLWGPISTTLPLEVGQEFSEPECKWGQTGAEPSVEDVASPGLQQAGRQGNQCPLPPPASTLWSSLVPPSGELSWKTQVLQGLSLHPSHLGLRQLCDCVTLLSSPTGVWVPRGRNMAHLVHCVVPGIAGGH